jgi:predicted esterase
METEDARVHKLVVSKTARVLTGGDESGKPFVFLHGYGVSVTGFFHRLKPLMDKGCHVIAPEGLSRYYREGAAGKVVASWMTREERLDDISDNNNYLEQVFESFCVSQQPVIIGFSQGAASMCRWALSTPSDIKDIVLWGSGFPPDITDEQIRVCNRKLRIHFLIGDEDEYLSLEQIKEESEKLISLGVETEVFVYKGGHNICSDGLQYIASI